jgi:hypothetical protein
MVYDKIDMQRERQEGFADGLKVGAAAITVIMIIIVFWLLGQP